MYRSKPNQIDHVMHSLSLVRLKGADDATPP